MAQKLILKPAESDSRPGDVIIEITDVQLHTNARGTESVGKNIKRSVEQSQPSRIYFSFPKSDHPGNQSLTAGINLQDPALLKMIEDYRKQGKRVFIKRPIGAMPIFPGKDIVEFINGVKGKRILRRKLKIEN